MFRSDPSERTDSTLPTTRTGTGVLQHLSGWETGDPSDPHRNRRPVALLGYESFGEMGCTHRRGPAGEAARRFCAAIPAEDRSRSCGRHPQGSRTRPHPGRHWRKAEPMPPSGTEAALGKSVQFLSERPTLGTHVCSPMSLLSLLRPSVPQSASLAGASHAAGGHCLSAMQKRLLAMLRPRTIARTRRLSDCPGLIALRAEVAGSVDSFLHPPRTTSGRLSAPALLFSGRAVRQPDLLPPRRRRSFRRTLAGHEPNHRTAEEDYSHLWPESDQAIQGQAANRTRRPQSSQSRHSQSLRSWIRQAVRPR